MLAVWGEKLVVSGLQRAPGCYNNPPLLGRLAKKREFIGKFKGLIAILLPTATVLLLSSKVCTGKMNIFKKTPYIGTVLAW